VKLSRLIRNPVFQVIALAIAYIIFASFISLLKHYAYNTYAADLGIYAQTVKSTLYGNILYNTPEGMNTLGYHFSPILLLLVPLIWLAPHIETLLVVQSIALGVSGCLVYKLARIQRLSHRTAFFVEVLFFISPLVWGVNFWDLHPVAFAVPTLLIMLIGLVERKWKIFAVGLFLSLMTKEDVVMALAVFGLVMLIAQYVKTRKVDKVYLVVFSSAIATYGIAVVVARAISGMDVPPMLMYGTLRYTYLNESLGSAIRGALGAFFSGSSMLLLLAYFLPLGLLPLFSPLWAAPAILILIASMLATKVQQHYLLQYPAAAIPFLFMALISTLTWMKNKGRVQLFLQRAWRVLAFAVIAVIILIELSPISVIWFSRAGWLPGPHAAEINRTIALIPDGATVTVPNHIFPHLCLRTVAYIPQWPDEPNKTTGDFGIPDRDTEYVVIDYQRAYPGEAEMNYLRDKYELVEEANGVSLFRLK
jgi:uncharacterized membrane protein